MKRFWFNLLWYLGVVVLVELIPIGLFLRLHVVWGAGSLAPQVISSAVFLALLIIQAFTHLRFLQKRYPERGQKNYMSTIGLTLLAYLTMFAILGILILWASNSA